MRATRTRGWHVPEDCLVLAVDVGGTKLEVGLVDGAGEVLEARRVPTPATTDPEEVWRVLAQAVTSLGDLRKALAVGVGCGGPMSAGGRLVSPLNIPAWRDFPLQERLSLVSGLTTWVDNDAKALALAEGWLGAGAGRDCYLSMVVSTGVGGGIVLDGRLLEGRAGNAGHIGHVVVEPEGAECGCGARGCLEAEASGRAIAALTGAPAEQAGPKTMERTGRLVGRAVASVVNLLDLDLAVVAGSVALGFGRPFFDAAQKELRLRARLDFSSQAAIVPSPLGARGPILGAAAVALRRLGLEGAAPS